MYEAPVVRVLGDLHTLTLSGDINKTGNATDAYTGQSSVLGSVTIITKP